MHLGASAGQADAGNFMGCLEFSVPYNNDRETLSEILKNKSLKGIGSERMVALKMADTYQGLDLVILPSDGSHGVNPLDLDNTLQLFDVRKGGGK